LNNFEKLNQIFRMVFDDNEITIKPEMTANDIDGWDSLSHINLIVAVESAYGIKFSRKDVLSFKNIGDLYKCLESKL